MVTVRRAFYSNCGHISSRFDTIHERDRHPAAHPAHRKTATAALCGIGCSRATIKPRTRTRESLLQTNLCLSLSNIETHYCWERWVAIDHTMAGKYHKLDLYLRVHRTNLTSWLSHACVSITGSSFYFFLSFSINYFHKMFKTLLKAHFIAMFETECAPCRHRISKARENVA